MEAKYNTRSPAVKRLMREAQELSEATYDYHAQPLADNLFEWHFTVRGPADSDFDGGIYHGRIILPAEYPMKPPNIIVLTPNGRFETGKKICLSISGHHPESWQPSWSIRTALLAIIGFMPTPGQGTIGSLDYPPEERKKLAKRSANFSCEDCGGLTSKLLKSKEESEDAKSTAELAKEIVKKMSMKGEDETKSKKEANGGPPNETEEEKYKRARKLYSERMQAIIKKRLFQSAAGTSATSSSAASSSSARASSSTGSASGASRRPGGTPGSSGSGGRSGAASARTASAANREVAGQNQHNYYVDIVIGLIVVAIAILLFRRFSNFGSLSESGSGAQGGGGTGGEL